jgi:hypothetical protein
MLTAGTVSGCRLHPMLWCMVEPMKVLDRCEPLFVRLDRVAGGRASCYRVSDTARQHPRTHRAFVWITWLLTVDLVIGLAAIVVALALASNGDAVPWAVWIRTVVVLGITVTLFYFLWRARKGLYWGYSRLRMFSKIFPVITLVLAAIPGLYPLWMVTEQIVFSLILIGVADFLDSDHMRHTFPKPSREQLLAASDSE